MRRKCLLFFALILLMFILLMMACRSEEPEDTVLMTIDGTPVDVSEGRLYLTLTRQAFEEVGGEEVWELSLAGRDTAQTAADKALESLIQTKVLSRQFAESKLMEDDWHKIDQSTEALMEAIGEEELEAIGLSQEHLRVCMAESYRAWKYQQSMVFLPGTKEEELEYQTAEAFVRYDTVDQQEYLQRVELDAIMVYTGEWIHDQWVEYPQLQRKEIRSTIEEARKLLEDGKTFEQIRKVYSEDASIQENQLFHDGVVQADTEETGILYRGQIQTDLAEKIFRTPAGEYTDILETPYGYMIVYVKSFAEVEPADYEVFRLQLARAREEYQVALMQELSDEQFEEEYKRLQTEAVVIVNEAVWEAVTAQP